MAVFQLKDQLCGGNHMNCSVTAKTPLGGIGPRERWIACMRFFYKWTLRKVADRLEEILSKREGRKYVPEYGVRSRNKIQRQHWRGGVRKWSCTKVRKAIPLVRELWPELYGETAAR